MHSECPLRISSYTEPNLCRAMPPQLHHRHGSKDSLSTQLGDLFGHLGPAFLLTRRAQVAKGTLHSTLAAFCVYKGAGFARAKFMVYWTQTRQHGRLKRRFHCFSDFGRQGWRVHWRGWHKGMNWRDVELAAVACSPIHWGNGNLKLIEWVIIVLQPRRWFHHTCRGSGKFRQVPSLCFIQIFQTRRCPDGTAGAGSGLCGIKLPNGWVFDIWDAKDTCNAVKVFQKVSINAWWLSLFNLSWITGFKKRHLSPTKLSYWGLGLFSKTSWFWSTCESNSLPPSEQTKFCSLAWRQLGLHSFHLFFLATLWLEIAFCAVAFVHWVTLGPMSLL